MLCYVIKHKICYNMCHVMLYNIKYVITCVMLCFITSETHKGLKRVTGVQCL